MIYPYLYKTYAALKNGGGSYNLSDVVSIGVTEERNGAFDLEMSYLYQGENADQIACEAFVMAVPQRGQAAEPMRVYEITTPINGILSIKAHHISYDLDGAVLHPFDKTGLANILYEINTQLSSLGFDFVFQNNGITVSHQYAIPAPQSAFSVLGELLTLFEAEVSYNWDPINQREVVTLNAQRGTASTATIAYGFNLLRLDSSVNTDAVYSAIYPYYKKEENGVTTLVTLPEETISTGAVTTRTRILAVDISSEFSSVPSQADLRAKANEYVSEIDWNAVESCSVDFVPLQNTTDYEDNIDEQSLSLCDTATVSAEVIGVERTAKVTRTVYNQMTEKYDRMTVGTIPRNIADTIAGLL